MADNPAQTAPAGGSQPSGCNQPDPAEPSKPDEAVWTYRGYKLRASEFTTAMVHLFRAEVQRANMWRQRLDTTTNWAVVTTGAALSIALTQNGAHVVILLNVLLVTVFLMIEARRYRYYELWAYRVRLMETDFFASMLVPPFHPAADWAEALSESLLHPQFPISQFEAIGRRLRRNYLYLYVVMAAAWLVRLWLIPTPMRFWSELLERAALGPIGGEWVLLGAAIFGLAIVLFSMATMGLHASAGEVLPRFGESIEGPARRGMAWFRPSHRRPQLLTLIITDRPQAVADSILQDMRRGVTALPGTGMYTHQERTILMCALTVTEVPQIKSLAAQADPEAFVVVIPAQEVLGKGFIPLQQE